jgi:membrane associated rhomboid family serine protease
MIAIEEKKGATVFWILPLGQDNRVKHTSWAVYSLIAINLGVFVWMALNLPDDDTAFFLKYGLPADDWHWYQFVTSSFLHGDLMHLIGNMLFLWLFGDSIEDALGTMGFLLLYFAGGLLGDLIYVHNNIGSDIPTVGASGCIAAIAGAYCVMFYDREIELRLLFVVFPITTFAVRAFWVVLFWFGSDLWRTFAMQGELDQNESVNYVLHGIGFVIGFVFGVIARVHGVMRRYERLPEGGRWFGYWSYALERRHRRMPRRR